MSHEGSRCRGGVFGYTAIGRLHLNRSAASVYERVYYRIDLAWKLGVLDRLIVQCPSRETGLLNRICARTHNVLRTTSRVTAGCQPPRAIILTRCRIARDSVIRTSLESRLIVHPNRIGSVPREAEPGQQPPGRSRRQESWPPSSDVEDIGKLKRDASPFYGTVPLPN